MKDYKTTNNTKLKLLKNNNDTKLKLNKNVYTIK